MVTFGIVGLIGSVMGLVFSFSTLDRAPGWDEVLGLVIYSLLIALSEEVLFRELIFPLFLHSYEEKEDGEMKAVLMTSLLFGLRHLLGLLENLGSYFLTFTQVIFTFMAGVYLAAVLLRTKAIWVLVAIHFLIDFLSFFGVIFNIRGFLEFP